MRDHSKMNLVSKDFGGESEMGDDRGFGRNEVEESILSGKWRRGDSNKFQNWKGFFSC